MGVCFHIQQEVQIAWRGDVYACCQRQPFLYGNICQTPLREIYESALPKLNEYLVSELPCAKNCRYVRHGCWVTPPSGGQVLAYDQLRSLQVMVGNLCNVRCTFCHGPHATRSWASTELLRKNIDLTPFEEVTIVGGEPLLIPECRDMFDMVAEAGKAPFFITNGQLIDAVWAEKIVRHSKKIRISISAATPETYEKVMRGSSWSKLLDVLEKLRHYRAVIKPDFQICGHFVIVPENIHEIPKFIQLAASLGIRPLTFMDDHNGCVQPYLDLHPELVAKVRSEMALVTEPFPPNVLRKLGLLL